MPLAHSPRRGYAPLLLAWLAIGPAAQAQTWTGLAAPDNNWTTVGNWDTGVPVSGGTAFFTGAGNGNVGGSLGGATQQVGAIQFDTPSAAAYTLGTTAGDGFSISNNNISSTVGAISVTSAVTTPQAINAAVTFTGAAPLITNAAASAGLTLGAFPGSATLAMGNATPTGLSFNASNGATITVNDVITGNVGGTIVGAVATGGLSLTTAAGTAPTGTIVFNAQNTYTGITNLNSASGSLVIQIGSSTDTASSATYTKGPFGVGTIVVNGNGTQSFLQAVGADQTIANPVFLVSGETFSNAATPHSLTLAGPITMGITGRTLTINTFGQNFTLGSAAAPSTPTLSATTNLNLGLNPAYSATAGGAATLVINDVIQDPPTPPPIPMSISYNSNLNSVPEGIVRIQSQNTYAGKTNFSGQASGSPVVAITIQIATSSVLNGSAIVSGPFGSGQLVPSVSTTFPSAAPPIFEPFGADQTVANAISLASGGFWAANASSAQDPSGPHNLTFSGAITMGSAGKVLTNNMVPGVALTLGSAAAPSTITLGTTGGQALRIQSQQTATGAGTTIINDVIQNASGGGAGSLIVQNGGTVILNAVNTYTGGTTVTGLGTGLSAVGAGATLGGVGTAGGGGTVTLSSNSAGSQGGIVYPGPGGTSAGTLNVPSMSWNPFGRYVFAYNPTSTTAGGGVNNLINGAGTLDLSNLAGNNPIDLNLLPLSMSGTGAQQTYMIAAFAGGITGAGNVTGAPFANGSDISGMFTLSGTYLSAPASFAMVVAGPGGGASQAIDLTFTPTLGPGTFAWTGAASGSWSVAANWSPAAAPASSINNQFTFGATPNSAMTNDIAGAMTLNSMTFSAGAPVYALTGNGLNFVTNGAGALPQIVSNSSNGVTIGVPLTLTNNLKVSGTGNVTLNGVIGGAGSLTVNSSGTIALSNGNTYSGGTNVLSGTVQVAADSALGTGNVTGGPLGSVSFTGTTATTKAFAMNGGTVLVAAGQTLTFNGSLVTGATLDGGGTFATNATNGGQFFDVVISPSVAITANSAKDQFVHVDSSAVFTVPAGINTTGTSITVNLNGFTNEGVGSITIGAGSRVNVANFQSYGMTTLTPAAAGQDTLLTNQGASPLAFNAGSGTFIGTPATAPGPSGPFLDGVDLHGHNLLVTGGLFVNNGFVLDSRANGGATASVIVGYNGSYKGAGTNFVPVITQNGGRFSAGNSPGTALFNTLTIGPGALNDFDWQMNDAGPSPSFPRAPGVAGGGTGNPVSGWSLIASEVLTNPITHAVSAGNLTWTATSTPGSQFDLQLETLLGPTTPVGTTNDGPMSDFDPSQHYFWPFVTWQGTYTGPTDQATLTADTHIDVSLFANSISVPESQIHGVFLILYDGANKSIDLVYMTPEPGTFSLFGAGLLVVWGRTVRRRRPVNRERLID